MEKITYGQLMAMGETEDRPALFKLAVIVISNDSFEKNFSLDARSYFVSSDNKGFRINMSSSSIWANSIDGSDKGVRIERYIDSGEWKVEYCYIIE